MRILDILQPVPVSQEQFLTGAGVIALIFLIAFLVTRYTRFGGGSNYGMGGDDRDDFLDL